MIVRRDDQWTTVQCKNLVGDNGEICDLCFKVLNDRFALTQQCPYCLGKIDLRPCLKIDDGVVFKPTKVSGADKPADAGTLLWNESAAEHAKRHFIKED